MTTVGAFVSHYMGNGGVAGPSSMEVFHRSDSNGSWTSIGSSSVAPANGWATVDVVLPEQGGQLRVDLTHSAEHTIVSELKIEGACAVSADDTDDDGDCDDADASIDICWASLSGGKFHTCGVKTDGSVECWGNNDYGQSTPP